MSVVWSETGNVHKFDVPADSAASAAEVSFDNQSATSGAQVGRIA